MTSFEIYREASVAIKEIRDVAPAHYVLKIESFSLFAKNNKEKYESNEFEAEGYKWKLILYPNGDESQNGEDHISIYLAVSGSSPFQPGGAIHVAARFSLYDQIRDRYLTDQGRVTRLHALKAQWGVPRFMPLKLFADPSNGYLVDDTCVFGAEVFVIKSSGVGERVRMLEESTSYTYEWKISGLLSSADEYRFSDVFTVGVHEWRLWVYPRGDSDDRGKNLSMYLWLNNSGKLSSGLKVNVRFVIRLKGPNNVVLRQPEALSRWFSSSITFLGWPSFMPLKMVRESLTADPCVIEAEVTVVGTASKLP
ncbi:hypothetical protein BT93_L1566 [Corymbia citriodora subsp. variegata]|uniref:MATH domain-containing protein n=1 Tax=Corymbia citriodora subsp. variegata TaxID=360336 RepID=A0A8T0CMI0_CORYI|nr:hypothetical protein BT93_L1566 [Corymbia citriodora subsp. variegata]